MDFFSSFYQRALIQFSRDTSFGLLLLIFLNLKLSKKLLRRKKLEIKSNKKSLQKLVSFFPGNIKCRQLLSSQNTLYSHWEYLHHRSSLKWWSKFFLNFLFVLCDIEFPAIAQELSWVEWETHKILQEWNQSFYCLLRRCRWLHSHVSKPDFFYIFIFSSRLIDQKVI